MNWNTPENKKLVQALLSLQNAEEAEQFLRDLLTENEIDEFAKRLLAAEMLMKGVHYTAIEEKTGFSSTTVARVSKWLKQGTGYKTILNRLHHHRQSQALRGMPL